MASLLRKLEERLAKVGEQIVPIRRLDPRIKRNREGAERRARLANQLRKRLLNVRINLDFEKGRVASQLRVMKMSPQEQKRRGILKVPDEKKTLRFLQRQVLINTERQTRLQRAAQRFLSGR